MRASMESQFLAVWQELAYRVIRDLAYKQRAFTTDEAWAQLDALPKPVDTRALSAAVQRARKEKLIAKSDLVVTSSRGVSGGRPFNIWLSVPLGGTLNDACEYVITRKSRIELPLFSNTEPERV